jgi:RNA polymerase sigma factor (TIGR02999 family)
VADDSEFTDLMNRASEGQRAALDRVMVLLYDDLRQLAEQHFARENPQHTLQPTALIHESFLRLIGQHKTDWAGREHFLALASTTMRRILTDHARARLKQKRGGGRRRVPLSPDQQLVLESPDDILAIHDALEKLERLDSRQAKIVEYRFFGGLTVPEVARALNVSTRTVEAEWTMIRAWLRKELGGDAVAETPAGEDTEGTAS